MFSSTLADYSDYSHEDVVLELNILQDKTQNQTIKNRYFASNGGNLKVGKRKNKQLLYHITNFKVEQLKNTSNGRKFERQGKGKINNYCDFTNSAVEKL